MTHRHANASDNKNNIVRRLFLFVLVWTSRVTIAAAFDSSRSFAHQRFEPRQLRHRCLDDFPLRSQLAAAKGRSFCDSRVDWWLVQSTQRKQVLEENIKMQTHGALWSSQTHQSQSDIYAAWYWTVLLEAESHSILPIVVVILPPQVLVLHVSFFF